MFNNYFPSKQAAIVWLATDRAGQLADNFLSRPADEPLDLALVAAVAALYLPPAQHGLPARWLHDVRLLVAGEPALYGEYLKAADAAEHALAEAIERRAALDDLQRRVLAAMVVGAERAAVMHWLAEKHHARPLIEVVRDAVEQAVAGTR